MRRRSSLARAAALVLLAGCATSPAAPPPAPAAGKDADRPLPDVICQPCGDLQPTAYRCAGPVMVRSDVPAARVPRLKRYCAGRRAR